MVTLQFVKGCYEGLRVVDQLQRKRIGIEFADAQAPSQEGDR